MPVVDTLPCKAGDEGLIPGCRTKIPLCLEAKKSKHKQKQYCNKFNKEFKNMVQFCIANSRQLKKIRWQKKKNNKVAKKKRSTSKNKKKRKENKSSTM